MRDDGEHELFSSTMGKLVTVADYIERLKQFPPDWRVAVVTPAGGGIVIEHREIRGESVAAIYGGNGGSIGENPLTEDEYKEKSQQFMCDLNSRSRQYTRMYGDHRFYNHRMGLDESKFGTHYDERIVKRMIAEGKITQEQLDTA